MSEAVIPQKEITGVILAGGRAQRMGGIDKGLIWLNGKPMIAHVIAALRAEIDNLLINANRNREKYAAFGYPVIPDIMDGYLGPLAGMASGMRAASTPYIVTTPCDSPLIPSNLVQQLYETLLRENADISVAHDSERMHPVFALIRRDLLPDLLDFLNAGQRKIDRWYARHRLAVAYFRDRPEAFRNVNSPEERAKLESELEVTHQ
ncbi:MAG: molybdenum cofactor guanylyltransferase [Gammaproteobacteria bacterium]|nr:molybdenum cofactor guanylyltransferase [Gammaproteobacteria bacterium]MDH3406828.1 molybdenum cofactor guanylyltransferase [Gammaproteobacteria bacterium]MDH3562333.1 molybdenum cofactor guanylyltransferase [Gammaproteobacteria bacterium]MDH5486649.1 molybdenum cofactor guanylyltransferase [Gammaproteobacteria bacterium]